MINPISNLIIRISRNQKGTQSNAEDTLSCAEIFKFLLCESLRLLCESPCIVFLPKKEEVVWVDTKNSLFGSDLLSILPRWFIKLGFHLLYNQMAWSYDLVAWSVSFGQWAAWRRLALLYLQPGPILELAYGTGGLFADMLDAEHHPVGIDFSPYMAWVAKRRLQRQNMPVPLSRAKAQALPFPSNRFSNVVATFPTNYIFEPQTLAEVYRVLKAPEGDNSNTGGRLIIVVEGQLRGPWPIRPMIDWLYKITDQHNFPAIKPLPQFEKHNFKARWETVEHEGAQARLLVADKD